ncbi:carbohydrate ABC transporter permease [Halothermothrix orenii]|uniref:Binding-protein-dependent transport systems inner membrane component n=1 Tax=Halothermothrix orenii (strain H 168 / OCM 544 / DSM 9562) TaxID=373903 RepID=B8CZU4_HALOH|nr:sugar ABC transporter permease [Halothermothrix orenii]ACL70796.1 binding-protein-dependent transport systems inner membrane component [Halothermothrix orenii H 168]
MNKHRQKIAWFFLSIPLILYVIWVIGPTLYTFFLSLTRYDGLGAPRFRGIKNYIMLFDDPVFIVSLVNNIKWLVIFMVIPVVLGLILALILNNQIRWSNGFKASIYMPMILSPVVIGLIWSWIYDPSGGLLNYTLTALGLKHLTRGWLSDPGLVLYCIIAAAVWRHVGYVMILFLAGLKTIPVSVLEAAQVDGADGWKRFWHIILPLLKPSTVIVFVVTIIQSFRAFDMVNTMTEGGPFNSSNVLANFMYLEAFRNYRMGYGASIAVILFLIMFGFIIIYLKQVMKDEVN